MNPNNDNKEKGCVGSFFGALFYMFFTDEYHASSNNETWGANIYSLQNKIEI